MATAIVKKCKRRGHMSITQYVREILDYISAPSTNRSPDDNDQSRREKCTSFMFLNPYTLDDTILNDKFEISKTVLVAKELIIDLLESNEKFESNDKIMSHYVMSFQNIGRKPTEEEIMLAVKHFLADMGYSDEHFAAAGIHRDTDHLHVHIVMCRASAINPNSNLVREGNYWWKNESQRFLARECERQPGVFELDSGVAKRVKKNGNIYNIIKSLKKSGCTDIDGVQERRTRKISYNRLLGFILDEVYAKIQTKWKWGNLYKELAEHGVFVEVRQHGDTKGLTFSLDGTNWRAASQFGARWTVKELSKAISGGFRNPRDKIRDIAEKAREQYPLDSLRDEYVVIDETTAKEAQHDPGKDADNAAAHAEATASTDAITNKSNIDNFHVVTHRAAGERDQNLAEGRSRKVREIEQSGGKSGEGIQGPEGSNAEGMRDTAGTGRRGRPDDCGTGNENRYSAGSPREIEKWTAKNREEARDVRTQEQATQLLSASLDPLTPSAPVTEIPAGAWLSLSPIAQAFDSVIQKTADSAETVDRIDAAIEKQASTVDSFREVLKPLPPAAPAAEIPHGSWLTLRPMARALDAAIRKTADYANTAERIDAAMEKQVRAMDSFRDVLKPLPPATPAAEIPYGSWLTLRPMARVLDAAIEQIADYANTAERIDEAMEKQTWITAKPADTHEQPAGSFGKAGPTGTGDGTPIAPAPDDDAAWNARLIQRMRQSTTTAREPALPPTPEPMTSPIPTKEPAKISTPAPDDDAAWDELFLERIRRQQAAQTEQENMEEMEEESLMPPLPPPRVCKRSIDPRMPEW